MQRRQLAGLAQRLGESLRTAFVGPQSLAFVPALTLAGYWLGGEGTLILLALLLPVCLSLAGVSRRLAHADDLPRDGLTGLPLRQAVADRLDALLGGAMPEGRSTACLALRVDGFDAIGGAHAQAFRDTLLTRIADRLSASVRANDLLVRLEGPCFAIVLSPIPRADLETLIQLSARIQGKIAESIAVEGTRVYATVSVGFCELTRAPQPNGDAVLIAAQRALGEAAINGPGAIRAYTAEIHRATVARTGLAEQVERALCNGEICAWFQPQVSTDTGKVTGFEALARWNHPERGVVPPSEFLGVVEDCGLSERLGEGIMFHALSALKDWDKAGHDVPRIGINFAAQELRNPHLVDKIKWELDRFALTPDRLNIEILETVVAQDSVDCITRNIWALHDLGCTIDLDDFGTGSASIANIRRFSVARIKIDRSFISHVDTDREQQTMVSAILTMAERLKLATLAEGVETAGEHAMLAQLGCGHVQGYSIARPMPLEDTFGWLQRHQSQLARTDIFGAPGPAQNPAAFGPTQSRQNGVRPGGQAGKTA